MDNYLKKLAEVWDKEKYPPGLYDAFIAHDARCGIYKGGECDCDPDITMKERRCGQAPLDPIPGE